MARVVDLAVSLPSERECGGDEQADRSDHEQHRSEPSEAAGPDSSGQPDGEGEHQREEDDEVEALNPSVLTDAEGAHRFGNRVVVAAQGVLQHKGRREEDRPGRSGQRADPCQRVARGLLGVGEGGPDETLERRVAGHIGLDTQSADQTMC